MSESEKLTLNVPAVDLGKMDLLVQEGLYSNRAEFLRAAIRSQLEKHRLELEQSVERNAFAIGMVTFTKATLEAAVAKGERLAVSVIGLLVLPEDVTPELALAAIGSLKVRGMFSAPEAVKAALASRST